VNLVDPFHLEAYGSTAINYNRDVEAFPLLKRILEKITGSSSPYASPTDMGVNRAGFGITDDRTVCEAARQEIIRRFFRYRCELVMGLAERSTVDRVERLMRDYDLSPESRPVVLPARDRMQRLEDEGGVPGECFAAALMLEDGRIVTGKGSDLMHSASAMILNAVKSLAGLDDDLPLLSPEVIGSIMELKRTLCSLPLNLDLEEVLIALSVSAASSEKASAGMSRLAELKGCEAHLTHMPSPGDESGLRNLGINVTSDPEFRSSLLYGD